MFSRHSGTALPGPLHDDEHEYDGSAPIAPPPPPLQHVPPPPVLPGEAMLAVRCVGPRVGVALLQMLSRPVVDPAAGVGGKGLFGGT